MLPPLVISIQSQVVFGHVGNSAAVFAMQAAGLEVAAIPTVLFSNTPDYPSLRGAAIHPDLLADLLRGAEERGLPQRAAWIVSGYLGSPENALLTADFVARCKAANPDLRYLCDPVMGDHDPGLYVAPEIAAILRDRLLPLADLAMPNSFELAHLAGRALTDLPDLAQAARGLRIAPGGTVVITGCTLPDCAPDRLETVIVGSGATRRQSVRRRPAALSGTGDLFAGLTLAGMANGIDLPGAVARAQQLTGLAIDCGINLGAREVRLTDPEFRQRLLTL